MVKEQSLIFCNSKFTACYFERTLNIYPPFAVSVAVLIINTHRSRAIINTMSSLVFFYMKNTNEDYIFK